MPCLNHNPEVNEWNEKKQEYNYRCCICHKQLTEEDMKDIFKLMKNKNDKFVEEDTKRASKKEAYAKKIINYYERNGFKV